MKMDIQLVLREMERNPSKRDVLSQTFSEVIMAFDFAPQHSTPHFQTVRRMLSYFSDSTNMGRLYINYPMMQSYRHFKKLPDPDYIKATASPWGYKELVQKAGCHIDLRRWGYDIFISVAVQNIRKTWWMLHSDNRLPDVDEYASIDWARVFDMELDHFTKTDTVYVLNTFVFAIIDFAPSVFFKLAQKHSIKFGNT